ncbi:LysE family transporter [Sulfitobacter sp. 20_GPM-1509m]|uniref:LysE family transporter n=1 Tax=Sulfitobacter sp. 20_GPM-1509m TaxID=1380367 RepID=UPI000490DAF5|nr:LysE family transporter [Sulfitobacter sp. 20_GPM-1509m]
MHLLTIAGIWAIAAATPGPNFFVVAQSALSGSRMAALAAVAGVATGTLVWGFAGWLGISAMFSAVPTAYLLLKLAGGAYLIFLGVRLLWSTRRSSNPRIGQSAVKQVEIGGSYRLGLMTNLANPKSAIFVTSIFATALPIDAAWTEGLAAVSVMVMVSVAWYALVALVLARPGISSAYLRGRRLIDGITGLFFAGFGFRLLLSQK